MVETGEQSKNAASMEENPNKKVKYDLTNVLNEFEFVKVLNESNQNKLIFVQAVKKTKSSGDDCEEKGNDAVVIFEKPHFSLDEVKSFFALANDSETDITNDIYKKICLYPTKPYNSTFKRDFVFKI